MKSLFGVRSRLVATIAGGAMCVAAGTVIATEFPAESGALSYSGRLTDSAGNPRTTTESISVTLFSAVSGGQSLCAASQPAVDLSATQGRFHVPLPELCLDAITDTGDVWAEVKVGATTLPRQKLGAVPFAVSAREAVRADVARTVEDGAVGLEQLGSGVLGRFAANEGRLDMTEADLESTADELEAVAATLSVLEERSQAVEARYSGLIQTQGQTLPVESTAVDTAAGLDPMMSRYVFQSAGTYLLQMRATSSQVPTGCVIGLRFQGSDGLTSEGGWDIRMVQGASTPQIVAGSASRIFVAEANDWVAVEGGLSCAPATLPGDGRNLMVRVQVLKTGTGFAGAPAPSVFRGATPTLHTGALTAHRGVAVTGYRAAKVLCEDALQSSTAHMCRADEILRSLELGLPVEAGWYSTATVAETAYGAGGTRSSRDCAGWTSSGANDFGGHAWTAQNAPNVPDCATSLRVLCCD